MLNPQMIFTLLLLVVYLNTIESRGFVQFLSVPGQTNDTVLMQEQPMPEKSETSGSQHDPEAMMNDSMSGMDETMEGGCSVSSKNSGNWSDENSWNRRIPHMGDTVCIDKEHSIVFDIEQESSEGISTLDIHGELDFSRKQDTSLFVETITIHTDGTLRIGSKRNPLPETVNANVVFQTNGNLMPGSEMFPHQLGIINKGGSLELHGKKVSRILEASDSLGNNASSIRLDTNSHGWSRGDEILIPATTFERNQSPENQKRLIANVSGNLITMEKALDSPANLPLRYNPIIANLSGNIILSSASPEMVDRRGHVMVMTDEMESCGNVEIDGVIFKDLGRTNKGKAISATNQKMMYPLHFHHCGLETQYTVENSVASGSPGWSFVNHRSNVVFRNNVAYDFTGAGFVTEMGNELGLFENNLAVGGKGIVNSKDEPEYPFRRLYITNSAKKRLRAADLGFHGDGFWMASPFVDVKNNIAAGNTGAGFLWYSLGLDDVHVNERDRGINVAGSYTFNELPRFAQKQMKYKTPKRYYKSLGNRYFMQQDLPLFGKIEKNKAYGNYVGLRIRYVSNLNLVAAAKFLGVDTKTVERYVNSEGISKKTMYIHDSHITDTTLLNNEIGLHSTYSSRVNYTNITIASNQYDLNRYYRNTKEFIKLNAPTGLEMNHSSNLGHSIKGLDISGYPICMRVEPKVVTVKKKRLSDCSTKNGTNYQEFVLDQKEVRKIR
jgi:hypothetical protein